MASVRLHHGDMRDVLATFDADSIDAVVCDPPYELGFMGKKWDGSGVSFDPETWRACHRVLKPGGHLLAFGGTRTVHRIAVAIEDAGFEIRDQIAWLFGSGFPKSLDVSKAMDKAAGEKGDYGAPKSIAHAGWIERGRMRGDDGHKGWQRPWVQDETAVDRNARKYIAATDLARQYDGYGTALKPAMEPIVVARKPLIGTVAANVTEYGTGALNIDGCRIGTDGGCKVGEPYVTSKPGAVYSAGLNGQRPSPSVDGLGRWPANVALDEDAAAMLDAQSGMTTSTDAVRHNRSRGPSVAKGAELPHETSGYNDSGGASRFYYVAKASRSERNAGLEGMPEKLLRWSSGDQNPGSFQSENTNRSATNHHPTVKPVALMRWLIRLVSPPDGAVILDPFLGSGTTGIAAVMEGVGFVGIEQSAEYLEIARRRIAHAQGPLFAEVNG